MEKLRSEIRSAFEKEQAAHPPISALRQNVVAAVTARRWPARSFQWLAVAAALVLGILVVVGLMSARLAHRAIAPVTNPKASPVADYGPPPAGVPLLYVHDPNNPTWLIGFDWAATPRATVKFDPRSVEQTARIQMAPDGQLFAAGSASKGGSGAYFDRLGQSIPWQGGVTGFAGGVWADDNRHQCSVSLDQTAFTWTLVTQLPGEAQRSVAVIARDQGIGQTGISLASCSFRNDQAIAVRTSIAWPTELWVLRLSDGKVIAHHTYVSTDLTTVVGSTDGVYIAENSGRSVGAAQGALKTVIRRVSDWTVVSTLEPNLLVLGFNTDDRLVLIDKLPMSHGPSHLEMIDWQAQRGIWNYDGPQALGSFVGQSKGFAIALKAPTQPQLGKCGNAPLPARPQIQEDPVRDIVIVRNDT